MADRPVTGDTGWGPIYDAYEEVSHNSDGTLKFSGNEDDGHTISVTTGFTFYDRDTVSTKVYTKFITGNLDAGVTDTVAHGITDADDILSVTMVIQEAVTSLYVPQHSFKVVDQFRVTYNNTNIIIDNRGTSMDATPAFRIKIEYIA